MSDSACEPIRNWITPDEGLATHNVCGNVRRNRVAGEVEVAKEQRLTAIRNVCEKVKVNQLSLVIGEPQTK